MKDLRYSRILLVLFASLLSSALLTAQSISGLIKDQEAQEPVIFATVFLEGTSLGALTDSTGKFTIDKIEKGEYWLVVSAVGYETHYQRILITEGSGLDLLIILDNLDLQRCCNLH